MKDEYAPSKEDWIERPGFWQRLGLGASLSLGTGLAAVGFTGFLAVSAFLPSAEAWSHTHGTDASAPLMGVDPSDDRVADSGQDRYGSDPLGDNPLYRVGELGEVTCVTPDLEASDPESMERFAHTVADCLDQAWGSYFEAAGLEFSSPNRVYWHSPGHSPCGPFPSEGTAAFYCGANQGLYLGVEDIVEASAGNDESEAYTFLLSHEYGHHVQGQSRVLVEFHSARAGVDQAEADELTRRNELQANCLSGIFLGASGPSLGLGEAERQNILDDVVRRSDRGGERTHGTEENSRLWTMHGMDRVDPAACNTWVAAEELVR